MFTYINPRFELVTGRSASALIGRPFTTVIPPESAETAITQFKRGVKGEKGVPYEIEIIHKSGSRIPVEFNVTTLRDTTISPSADMESDAILLNESEQNRRSRRAKTLCGALSMVPPYPPS
jgi:PAS domain-containing protein